ncbi:MAG: CDGSH iron-sulfur domain-containing protein [Rhodospirillales bacterium]|nr:CDGSH iron-sulfur domain-containing protein [Rhodospirillales bacterium]
MNDKLEKALPASPQSGPYVVQVEEGREYRWCSCGLSANQPWCDGSHEGTPFEPIAFVAPLSAEFHMCGCKRSDNKPYCFGTCRGQHRTLDQR